MSHSHFTLSDRIHIQVSLEAGDSRRTIAAKLGTSHTAVNQEVRNNSVILEVVATSRVNKPRILSLDLRSRRGRGEVPDKEAALVRYQQRLARWQRGRPAYDAEIAQTLYLERRAEASLRNRKLVDGNALAERLTKQLTGKNRDSPEQLAADLRKDGTSISCQTIYNWIRRSSNRHTLEAGLPRRGRRRRTATGGWNTTRGKRSIHTRPVVIEELTRYGDLEGDTIFGRDSKDRILSHVDRVTGLLSLSLILGYNSDTIHRQTVVDIRRVFGSGIHTITYDNGNEFAAWKRTEASLGATVYFADPYRSSQRGRNENANGLVRDYFPKGTDFKQISRRQLRAVETILNRRSRKRYTWRNPLEQRAMILGNA